MNQWHLVSTTCSWTQTTNQRVALTWLKVTQVQSETLQTPSTICCIKASLILSPWVKPLSLNWHIRLKALQVTNKCKSKAKSFLATCLESVVVPDTSGELAQSWCKKYLFYLQRHLVQSHRDRCVCVCLLSSVLTGAWNEGLQTADQCSDCDRVPQRAANAE